MKTMLNQTRSKKFSSLTRPASLQRLGLFLTAAALFLCCAAIAQTQTASDYCINPFGYSRDNLVGISNSGLLAGYSYDTEYEHAIGKIWSIETRRPVGISHNISFTFYKGINSSNVVVGAYGGDEPDDQLAIVVKNRVQSFLTPRGSGGPAEASSANGINDRGTIVGTFYDRLGTHGFILKNGIYTVLDVPGAAETFAIAINNHDVVTVQAAALNGPVSSYVYQNGIYTPLNVPGALNSYIGGINDAGTIVYSYQLEEYGVIQSKVYKGRRFFDLTIPGADYVIARGINNAGVIVGDADAGISITPFVATPVR